MKAQGGGKIINIGSMMSIFGASFAPAYAASKGGMVQLTKSLAAAWARDNIQVNAVLPGWIDSELTHERSPGGAGASRKRAGPDAGQAMGRGRRPGAASPCSWRAAASDFVTGTAIPVDGGFSIQG